MKNSQTVKTSEEASQISTAIRKARAKRELLVLGIISLVASVLFLATKAPPQAALIAIAPALFGVYRAIRLIKDPTYAARPQVSSPEIAPASSLKNSPKEDPFSRWYVRYPMAFAILGLAIYSNSVNPSDWVVPLAILSSLFLAYEILIFGIVLLLLYPTLKVMATVPAFALFWLYLYVIQTKKNQD